jgi:hypothetical protein
LARRHRTRPRHRIDPRRVLGSPARRFRWTEYGLKGWSLTGVLAYADLAAGYSGFQFWTDLLSMGSPASYVGRDASSGRFLQTRPFTFAAYVNNAWDEGINYSIFQPVLGREVAAALAHRELSLPVGDCRSLASLPDARLYVNPACLLPDLEGPECVEPVQDHADLRRARVFSRGPEHEKPIALRIDGVGLSAVGGRRRQAGRTACGACREEMRRPVPAGTIIRLLACVAEQRLPSAAQRGSSPPAVEIFIRLPRTNYGCTSPRRWSTRKTHSRPAAVG